MNLPIVKRLCSISRASCVALALSLFSPGLMYAASITQIFVLHSYSQEYLWTRGQHEGFIQALAEDAQASVAVSTEYLDTKRRDYDETYASDLARHLRMKYKGYKPAAIYVTDDNALLFARDHLSRVFPGTPVFFSGVNDYGVRNSLDPAIFTGVFELKEVAPNIEWLLRMDKDANDLVFIGDGSNTYQAIEREARKDLIPYRLRATFIAEKRLDRALARLHDLPGKYLFLTTLGGMTDANGQVLPLHDIMKSLALAGRIVISMEDAYIIEGVMGGYVTSGQHQGMNAARLFLAYLHGKPIVDLPPMLKSPNALIFDDRVLHQYGINLPESLRAQAVLLNPHPGFYERYRSLILGSLIGLAALLFLVVTGSLVIMSRKNRELGLARNSAESANTLFTQLAGQSRTVHWEVNAEGLYTYVSPVSYAVLGYRPEELVDKKHFYDLLTEEERDTNKTAALEFFAQKEPFHNMENKARTRDGRLIWILTNGLPVLDDHGTFLGYRGSDSDITERKKAEEARGEIEERFRLLVQNAPEAIFVQTEGCFAYLNPTALRLFGADSPDQLLGRPMFDRFHPDFHDIVKQRIHQLNIARLNVLPLEQKYLKCDGTPFDVEVSAVPITYEGHNGALVFFHDITERKRAEESLLFKENIIEYTSGAVATCDLEGNMTYGNPSFLKTWGFGDPKEFLGRPFWELWLIKDRLDEIMQVLRSEGTWMDEIKAIRKDGTIFDVQVSAAMVLDSGGNPDCLTSTSIDITERKRAEEELQLHMVHTQTLLDLHLLANDSQQTILDFALEASQKTCRSQFSFIGLMDETESFATIHAWSKDAMAQCSSVDKPIHFPIADSGVWGDCVRQRKPVTINDYEAPCPSKKGYPEGHVPIRRFLSVPVFDGDKIVAVGAVANKKEQYTEDDVHMLISLLNKTSELLRRKQAEETLREREEKYRNLFNNAEVGIFRTRLDGSEVLEVNRRFLEIVGMTMEETLGRPSVNLWADPKEREEMVKRLVADGSVSQFEYRMLNKRQGDIRNCLTSLRLYREQGILEGSILDITDRKQAEEEKQILQERLQHADKMEAIGTLAGGIAHDFNNLLMGIQGHASLTLLDLDPSHPHYERLKSIEEQVQSGADLTRQLLGFARGGRYDVKPTDMNDIIKETSSMFGRTKKEISIHRKYGKDLRPVEVDRGQMEQVFMNLYVNAWQAMPGGGEIYLETENVLLDDEQAVPYAVMPGKYVKITVTDTGTGMDEKTRERIFDPFFTTKGMGRGTGLGLATVYGIIKGHKGMIHVDSEPGHGTTFTIYLPASEKEVVKEKTATGTIARGTETILLVDDEKMVLEVSRELLESMGYRVYAAGSGQEALAVYMEKQKEIALVLLGMIMPGMSGGETFDRLREINTGIKVLLSSGYSIEGQAQEILERGCNGFLQKPFRLANLSRKVREMLD